MTLLPSSDFGIRGHAGNAYDVNEVCAHPTCDRRSAHAHHCWSRSYLRGQPYEWVAIADLSAAQHGTVDRTVVIGNRLGFCVQHHDMLTGEVGGYRARLIWEAGVMWWEDRFEDERLGWSRDAPTSAQPPVAGKHTKTHDTMGEGQVCPTCGHHARSKSDRTEPRSGKVESGPDKEWVAAGDVEGARLLDEHVDDFAVALGMSDWSKRQRRYHVTSIVFAWVQQHRSEFIADVAEAAERRLKSHV